MFRHPFRLLERISKIRQHNSSGVFLTFEQRSNDVLAASITVYEYYAIKPSRFHGQCYVRTSIHRQAFQLFDRVIFGAAFFYYKLSIGSFFSVLVTETVLGICMISFHKEHWWVNFRLTYQDLFCQKTPSSSNFKWDNATDMYVMIIFSLKLYCTMIDTQK